MNKNDGFFVFAELILEKNTLGVFPSYKILSYLPTFIGNTDKSRLELIGDLRLLATIFFTLLVLMLIVSHPKVDNGFYPGYIYTLEGLLNLAIIGCTILSNQQYSALLSLEFDQNELYRGRKYIDLGQAASYYELMFLYSAFALGLCIIRLVLFLQFYKPFKILVITLEQSTPSIILNFIYTFIIISGFAIVTEISYGQHVRQFSNFSSSFVSMLLIFYGIFDFDVLEPNYFTLIFLNIYIFMIGFFMMNLITATYID